MTPMLPLEPVVLSFGAALFLGLSFGAGPCNVACLPYLGPVFMATGGGPRQAWRTLLPFSLGRLSGYALLGAIAGWVGLLVQDWLKAPWVPQVLGFATILVALALFWRLRRKKSICSSGQSKSTVEVSAPGNKPMLPGGLFFMGAGMALNPCAPLTTIIFAAATTASAWAGLSLGLGFGLGAVLIPSFIFGLGVAHFGEQIRYHLKNWQGTLENTSIALLVLMGISTSAGWIVP